MDPPVLTLDFYKPFVSPICQSGPMTQTVKFERTDPAQAKDMINLHDKYTAQFILEKFKETRVESPSWAQNKIKEFLKLRNDRKKRLVTDENMTEFEKSFRYAKVAKGVKPVKKVEINKELKARVNSIMT